MVTLPKEILDSTHLPDIVEQLSAIVRDEASRRARFRAGLDEKKKAEFINGEEIEWNSPVKRQHGRASLRLAKLLDTWSVKHRCGEVHIEKALVAFTRNDYEPDVCWFDAETAATFSEGQQLFPVPAFIAEVLSPSTEKNDRGIKFADYESHGVREYWIIDADACVVEQYVLEGDKYRLLLKSGAGNIESRAIAGFRVPIEAIFDDDACQRAMGSLV